MSHKSRRNQIQLRSQQTTTVRFVGPLPPPELLKRYDEVIPGGAERIIALAERQSAHRQELEKTVINSNCKNERLGTILGFVLAMIALIGGFALVAAGFDVGGIAAIVSALGSLVGVFIYGKKKQQEDRADKIQQLNQSRAD